MCHSGQKKLSLSLYWNGGKRQCETISLFNPEIKGLRTRGHWLESTSIYGRKKKSKLLNVPSFGFYISFSYNFPTAQRKTLINSLKFFFFTRRADFPMGISLFAILRAHFSVPIYTIYPKVQFISAGEGTMRGARPPLALLLLINNCSWKRLRERGYRSTITITLICMQKEPLTIFFSFLLLFRCFLKSSSPRDEEKENQAFFFTCNKKNKKIFSFVFVFFLNLFYKINWKLFQVLQNNKYDLSYCYYHADVEFI